MDGCDTKKAILRREVRFPEEQPIAGEKYALIKNPPTKLQTISEGVFVGALLTLYVLIGVATTLTIGWWSIPMWLILAKAVQLFFTHPE